MVTHFLCDHADLFICLDQHLCRLIDPEAAKIILKGLPILFAEDLPQIRTVHKIFSAEILQRDILREMFPDLPLHIKQDSF